MIHTDLTLTPRDASDSQYYLPQAAKSAGIDMGRITSHAILHKSVDARGRDIVVNMRVALFIDGEHPEDIASKYNYRDVSNKPSVVVVGMGPAGLFAALRLIELGLRPIGAARALFPTANSTPAPTSAATSAVSSKYSTSTARTIPSCMMRVRISAPTSCQGLLPQCVRRYSVAAAR